MDYTAPEVTTVYLVGMALGMALWAGLHWAVRSWPVVYRVALLCVLTLTLLVLQQTGLATRAAMRLHVFLNLDHRHGSQ